MNKFIQRNINQLKRQKTRSIEGATKATVKRIDEIIKLYTERKISNKTTAENLIKGLTSDNKKVYDKALQKYKESVKDLKERQPLNKRMAEARKKKEKNTYLINFLLYTVRKPKNQKIKPRHLGKNLHTHPPPQQQTITPQKKPPTKKKKK